MHTHDFVLNEGRNRQVVEKIRKLLPHVRATVLLDTLVVEAVHISDGAGLVVTSDEENAVFVSYFV